MPILEYDPKTLYRLLQEINRVRKYISSSQYEFNQNYPELRELRFAIRNQLAGLIDAKDDWINYANIDSVKQELYETNELMKRYDSNNPFQRSLPQKQGNLYKLLQQMCEHKNKSYSSLRGSMYQTLYCDDCHAELGPMEFKPKVLKMLNEIQDKEINNKDGI